MACKALKVACTHLGVQAASAGCACGRRYCCSRWQCFPCYRAMSSTWLPAGLSLIRFEGSLNTYWGSSYFLPRSS